MPFNPVNRLITPREISAILKKYGVDRQIDNYGEFYKAMVHRSYCTRKNENFISGNTQCPKDCLPLQEESLERLELLGDAVLGLIVAEYLYERFPGENEGFLTRMRSKIVNGTMLAQLSSIVGLNAHVIISKQIEENNGRSNKNILEDCFEAFIGAMYITLQYKETYTWFISFLEENVDVTELVLTQNNFKETLSKYYQHTFNCQPKFIEDPSMKSRVIVKSGQVVVGVGSGATRKLAEEEASSAALKYFGLL